MATSNVSERINRLFDQEKWSEARRIIQQEMRKVPARDPIRHWWLTRLSTTYYEEKQYGKALATARRAAAIAPACPLVLWDMAGALTMLGREDEAIPIYESIIDRGLPSIANHECGEGEDWAAGLIADSFYRLSLCYDSLGETEEAFKCAEEFREWLEGGASSIYGSDDADDLSKRLYEKMVSEAQHRPFADDADAVVLKIPSSYPSLPGFRSLAEPKSEGASLCTPDFLMVQEVGPYTSTDRTPERALELRAHE